VSGNLSLITTESCGERLTVGSAAEVDGLECDLKGRERYRFENARLPNLELDVAEAMVQHGARDDGAQKASLPELSS
jgi:hypothetical protein